MKPGVRGRRALQVLSRAQVPVVVFVVAYLVVVRTGIATGDPLLGPEIPAALTALTVFGWAVADGRRPDAVARPVRLWAVTAAATSLSLAVLFVVFAFTATVALGGSLAGADTLRLLGFGTLSAAAAAACIIVLAAGGVRIGRQR